MSSVRILLCLALIGAAMARPNVVVFLADDQGWGDLSIHGNSNLSTPHIDSLAKEGTCFDRFFVGSVCAPTRAAFFTGRYHLRTGVTGVSTGRERLNEDELTIGEIFKAAGYATGAFGKWHNGTQYPNHPNARGFEEYYGFTSGHWGQYFSPMLDHNGTFVKGEGYITDDLTNKAMKFIGEQAEAKKPFFAYLPYCTPHSPMQVPDEFWDRFANKDLKMKHRDRKKEQSLHLRAALAMCENIDWNVGRVLKQLDDLGLADDTIVIYFSDNGPNGFRWNDGMKGKKGAVDEGGLRVPFFIRWPGKIPAGHEVKEIADAIDILPTLTDLVGIKRAEPKPIDGLSLKPLIMKSDGDWPDRVIYSTFRGKTSLRTPRYRLSDKNELFDMIVDPSQDVDVASREKERHAELVALKNDWFSSVQPKPGKRPFVVGYPGSPYTQLPARDGESSGGIKRSSIHPNCSYFLNWNSPEDRITWNVDVATAGKYRVDLRYACPESDLGSELELIFKKSRVSGKITVAHDPPLIGKEDDRSPRTESYVKDFKPMTLGTIELEKGMGTLSLRALNIPGKQAMELRLLRLTQVE